MQNISEEVRMCACACLEGESRLEEIMKLPVSSLRNVAHAQKLNS